jgi:hypothetical protein
MQRIKILLLALISIFMLSSVASALSINGFQGYYDPSNWDQIITDSNGSIDTSGAPNFIHIFGSNDGSDKKGYTLLQIDIPAFGLVSFSWEYSTADTGRPDLDPFTIGETNFPLTNDSGPDTQTGTYSQLYGIGDAIKFGICSIDNLGGAAEVIISNFQAPAPVPVPAAIYLLGAGFVGIVGLRKKLKK